MPINRTKVIALSSLAALLVATPGSWAFLGDAFNSFLKVDALEKMSVLIGLIGLFGAVNFVSLIPKLQEVASLNAIAESEKKLRTIAERRMASAETLERRTLESKEIIESGTPLRLSIRAKAMSNMGELSSAILILEDGLSAFNEHLVSCYRSLSCFYIERNENSDLEGAARTTAIANALAVGSNNRDGLAVRIIESKARADFLAGTYFAGSNDADYSNSDMESPDDEINFVSDLCHRSRNCLNEGDYFSAHRLAIRARNIAAKWPPPIPLTPDIRNLESLAAAGRSADVLQEIAKLEPRLHAGLSSEADAQWIKYIKMTALTGVGDFSQALLVCDKLLTSSKEFFGDEHPNTLSVRSSKAQILLRTGNIEYALEEINIPIQVRKRNYSKLSPEDIPTYWVYFKILGQLGRYEEISSAIDDILPPARKMLGEFHPKIIGLMGERADAISRLGRNSEALVDMDTVISASIDVYGYHNPNTFAEIYRKAGILLNSNANEDALALIENFRKDQENLLGLDHPDIEAVETGRVSALIRLGRTSEAVKCIDEFAAKRSVKAIEIEKISPSLAKLKTQALAGYETPDLMANESQEKLG